jgi:hypothetical protein
LDGLTAVLSELLLADVRNVAVGTNQNPWPFGRGNLGCAGPPHVFEEPASVGEPDIGHAISGLQASDRITRRQGAGPIVQGELIGHVAALDRLCPMQALA